MYDMSMICLWYVYDMSMICLWYVYDMSMICLWYVYDMSMIGLWKVCSMILHHNLLILNITNILIKNIVKPEYSGHPWDHKKVAVVQRWSLFRGWSKKGLFFHWLKILYLQIWIQIVSRCFRHLIVFVKQNLTKHYNSKCCLMWSLENIEKLITLTKW
jgi:hypothetical protein